MRDYEEAFESHKVSVKRLHESMSKAHRGSLALVKDLYCFTIAFLLILLCFFITVLLFFIEQNLLKLYFFFFFKWPFLNYFNEFFNIKHYPFLLLLI